MTALASLPQPTVLSRKIHLEFAENKDCGQICGQTRDFLRELTTGLQAGGCQLIGHIKGIMTVRSMGFLLFGLTSFDDPLRFKGGIKGRSNRADFALNIIVYGIEEKAVAALFETSLQNHLR